MLIYLESRSKLKNNDSVHDHHKSMFDRQLHEFPTILSNPKQVKGLKVWI